MADEIQPSSSASITNNGIETNKSPIGIIENTESNNRLLSTDTHETFVTAITSSNSGEGERTESFVTARGQTSVVLEEEETSNNDTEILNETMNGAAAILELANELDNNNIEDGNNIIENSTTPIEEVEEEDVPTPATAVANILPTVRTPPKTNSTTTKNNNNQSVISNNNKTKQRQKELKRLDKLQRRIPPTLDLDYITTSIIGMAPPRGSNFNNTLDNTTGNVGGGVDQHNKSPKKKRPKGNSSIDLSTYLEKRHTKRYLLFNVSDEIIDDRSLLLLNRQIVHLPWGSPRIYPSDIDINRGGDGMSPNRGAPPPSSPKDNVLGTPGSTTNNNQGNKSSNNSSGTPSIARVMDICYALHAYLSIPPSDNNELPLELLNEDDSTTPNTSAVATSSSSSSKRRHNSKQSATTKSSNNNTVACIYCSNGKTRTGVIIACYLKFCNVVSTSLKGFEIFCDRRGIMSSTSSNSSAGEGREGGEQGTNEGRDISSHIPPSLRQFFNNFDTLIQLKHYPYPSSIILQSIQLSGVPVDDMPCIDIYEFGNTAKQLVYSSHSASGVGHSNNNSGSDDENSSQEDMNKLNKWYDEEGIYNIGQLLIQDFTLVCRFGGEFQYDTDDPSKVLFRYVNCPNFINGGGGSSGEGSEGDSIEGSDSGNNLELTMVDVDMMRRYADSFDDEDFMLTLIFENVNDEDDTDSHLKSPTQKNRKHHRRTISFSSAHGISVVDDGTKFNGTISNNEREIILQGWKVLSDAHLSHHALDCEDELLAEFDNDASLFMVDNTTTAGGSQHYEIDFKHVALQFTNGDVELAKVELMNGLFKSLFANKSTKQQSESLQALQQPVLDDDIQHSIVKEEEEEEEEQSALSAYCSTVGSTDNDYSTVEPDSVLSTEAESALTAETGNYYQEVAREYGLPSSSQLPSVTSADEEDEDSKLPRAKSNNEEDVITEPIEKEVTAANEVDLKPRVAAVPMESESVQQEVIEKTDVEQKTDTVDEGDHDSPSVPKPSQQSPELESACPADDANERRSTAETLDADTTSSEEGSTTNTPFRDPNQSTLLDAIQMRGLKNNMALSPYSDRKKLSVAEGLRSSLLIEIRNKASMKDSADSPPSPSPVEEEKKISDVNDSENIDPADVELTASPRNEVEQFDESIIEDVNDSEEKVNVASDTKVNDEVALAKDGQDNSDQVNDSGDDTHGNDTAKLVATSTADNDASEKSEPLQNVDEVPSKSAWSSRLGFPSDWQALPENGKVLTGFKGRPSDATKPDFDDMNSTIVDSMTEMKDEQLPLNKDPTYEKFYRMLKTVRLLCVLSEHLS